MPDPLPIILGEFPCKLDDRYRVLIPGELGDLLPGDPAECVLAKERAGCLSLWSGEVWQAKVALRLALAEQKVQAGLHDARIGRVQLLGRLLSTRHQRVQLRDRRRLLVPKSFREFLGATPGKDGQGVIVVGAAVCIEIWNPPAWLKYVEARMPRFRRLVNQLS